MGTTKQAYAYEKTQNVTGHKKRVLSVQTVLQKSEVFEMKRLEHEMFQKSKFQR